MPSKDAIVHVAQELPPLNGPWPQQHVAKDDAPVFGPISPPTGKDHSTPLGATDADQDLQFGTESSSSHPLGEASPEQRKI